MLDDQGEARGQPLLDHHLAPARMRLTETRFGRFRRHHLVVEATLDEHRGRAAIGQEPLPRVLDEAADVGRAAARVARRLPVHLAVQGLRQRDGIRQVAPPAGSRATFRSAECRSAARFAAS